MKTFISNMQKHFNSAPLKVLDDGINLLLSPAETISILYFYFSSKNIKTSKEKITMCLGKASLINLKALFTQIKQECQNFLQLLSK